MNSFGRLFRITIFGESHGPGIGVTIDGCPPGIPLKPDDFYPSLARRQPSHKGTTARQEQDEPIFLSGIFKGYTTGAPVTIWFENKNVQSADYEKIQKVFRPGHADFVAHQKYQGFNDYRGGGIFSGRVTVALVAAGVIAQKVILPISISARILEIGGEKDYQKVLAEATNSGDSLGGIIECEVNNLPVGLGEPFFDSVESLLSHILFSIPGIKGVEFGAGFESAKMRGSEYNDPIIDSTGKTLTNNAGGINGGITNGNPLIFRVAVRPPASIKLPQRTYDFDKGEMTTLEIQGRHDACFALRLPVIIESATSIVLADLLLIQKARTSNGRVKQ